MRGPRTVKRVKPELVFTPADEAVPAVLSQRTAARTRAAEVWPGKSRPAPTASLRTRLRVRAELRVLPAETYKQPA